MATASAPFTQEAQPGTDIWRKPPTANIWNAPLTRTATGPLKKFLSARVTFRATWTEQYDQAGLLLVPRLASSPAPAPGSPPDKWFKAGVELYEGAPQLSAVSCDRWADWSVAPLSGSDDAEVTIEAVREGDEHGRSVWVYRVVRDPATGEARERRPLREICWILADEEDADWVLDVSPLVARPEKNAAGPLSVEFSEFEVAWLP